MCIHVRYAFMHACMRACMFKCPHQYVCNCAYTHTCAQTDGHLVNSEAILIRVVSSLSAFSGLRLHRHFHHHHTYMHACIHTYIHANIHTDIQNIESQSPPCGLARPGSARRAFIHIYIYIYTPPHLLRNRDLD